MKTGEWLVVVYNNSGMIQNNVHGASTERIARDMAVNLIEQNPRCAVVIAQIKDGARAGKTPAVWASEDASE